MKKKTLILGATNNPARYAFMAANRLVSKGHPIVNIGLKQGEAAGVPIEKADKVYTDIDTVTIYLSPENQEQYYDYIIKSKPRRIIFNPGAENPELEEMARQNGIETSEACTLVLLSTGQY